MFDAFFFVSFGGPESPEDVMPFLENVLRGKHVPEARMKEVAEHYMQFGGKSPINDQNKRLMAQLQEAFDRNQINLPIYWGNRNWNPYIQEALEAMKKDGIEHALAYFTSSFSCYSGCRQYRENIATAQQTIGEGAPQVSKIRMPFNHPLFIKAAVENLQDAYQQILQAEKEKTLILFSAHSIPLSMSENADYVKQLEDASALVASQSGFQDYRVVYQSRSGPPQVPWLEPDVSDVFDDIKRDGFDSVIVMPLGFVTDHMEVLYDLDVEAKQKAESLDLGFARAHAVGHNTLYVDMIVDLVQERIHEKADRKAIGELGPWHDTCPPDCCKYTPRRPTR